VEFYEDKNSAYSIIFSLRLTNRFSWDIESYYNNEYIYLFNNYSIFSIIVWSCYFVK